MQFHLPNRLKTERLLLRPFQRCDLDAFLSFMTDERATRYLQFTLEQRTEAGARNLFETVIASYGSNAPTFVLAICSEETEEYIGSCGFSPVADDEVECFYTILSLHWGNGYATEAMQELLQWAAHHLPIRRIVANVAVGNPPSRRVAEKCGMREDPIASDSSIESPRQRYVMDMPQRFGPPT